MGEFRWNEGNYVLHAVFISQKENKNKRINVTSTWKNIEKFRVRENKLVVMSMKNKTNYWTNLEIHLLYS